MRDEERDLIFNEFKDRKGELIKGVVRRFEKGNNLIVDLGRTEALLPVREQTQRETFYRPGDRIVAYVKDIDREARGPQVILSRSDPRLVEKLFEAEGPAIYEGIVKIVACAREPGARSKIAVTSRDADVDPVGACVGMKGARVQAVVQELRGEKIDIVPYDRDPARFVCAAIQPAEVSKVIVDEADGRMELVVPDEKLSLAIGRKGQNVRLAAQLSGWKLDIISEAKFKQMEEEAVAQLQQVDGVTEAIARGMYRLGFRTLEELAEAGEQELATMPGLSAEVAARVHTSAETTMERLRQERIRAASSRTEPLTERERLLFIRGVGERTVQLLEDAGYRAVEDILREDEDKLAIKTGLGIKKARAIKQGAQSFLAGDSKVIEAARREAIAKARDAASQPSRRRSNQATVNEHGPTLPHACARRGARAPALAVASRPHVRRLRRARRGASEMVHVVAVEVRWWSTLCSRAPGSRLGRTWGRPRGRGAHVHPRLACLGPARAGLSRAFRRPVTSTVADVSAAILAACERRMDGLLLSARRIGAVEAGADAALAAAQRGGAPLLIVAVDAGAVAEKNEVRGAVAAGRAIAWRTKADLGRLLGEASVAICAVGHAGIAAELKKVREAAGAAKATVEAAVSGDVAMAELREGARCRRPEAR